VGSLPVRYWFATGSCLVQGWLTVLSRLVPASSAAVWVLKSLRILLLVLCWFAAVSPPVCRCLCLDLGRFPDGARLLPGCSRQVSTWSFACVTFRCCLPNCGWLRLGLKQIRCRFGAGSLWFATDCLGSLVYRVGSRLVHRWHRVGSLLVRLSPLLLVLRWPRLSSQLVWHWAATGSGLVHC
jgi:hypothetical protein